MDLAINANSSVVLGVAWLLVPSRSRCRTASLCHPLLTQLHDPLQDKVAAKSKTPLKPNNKIIAPVAVRPAVLPGPRLLRTLPAWKQRRIGERALCVQRKADLTECPAAGRRTAPRGLLWHANA